jgi:DNA-binding protein HU-beta
VNSRELLATQAFREQSGVCFAPDRRLPFASDRREESRDLPREDQTVNKAQLVEALSTRLGEDKKRTQATVDALLDTVYRTVQKGEKVALTGFGVFEKRDRAARTARNPATGEKVRVKKTSVPAFRAGQEFKNVVNGSKKLAKVAPAKAAAATAAKSTAKAAPAKATTTRSTTAAKATPARATKTAAKATPAKKTAAAKTLATKSPAPAKATKTAAAKTLASKTTATKAPAAKKTTAKATPAKKAAAKSTPRKTAAKTTA